MSGIFIWAIAAGVEVAHTKLQARRSPLLPPPPAPALEEMREVGEGVNPAVVAPPPKQFTVRDLKQLRTAWSYRSISLNAKVRGLEHCRAEGWPVCWAGRVEDLRFVRRAASEAQWVLERLEQAIVWCKAQTGVKKAAYLALPNSKKPRPAHTTSPPSLCDLPWPLPQPLALGRYELTVPRPVFVPPPAYHEEPNEEQGESTVMSGEAPEYRVAAA